MIFQRGTFVGEYFLKMRATQRHRSMQRLPSGINVPINKRKCDGCNNIFKSEQGLKGHQSRKTNVKCYRVGVKNVRKLVGEERQAFKEDLKKQVPEEAKEISVAEKHKKGCAYKKEEKQAYLNVFQSFKDKGLDEDDAIIEGDAKKKEFLVQIWSKKVE